MATGLWWPESCLVAEYDEMLHERNEAYAYECSLWLRGFEDEPPYQADYSDITWTPKPSRDIRREKTREYRKRRPRPMKVNPAIVQPVSVLYAILGVFS